VSDDDKPKVYGITVERSGDGYLVSRFAEDYGRKMDIKLTVEEVGRLSEVIGVMDEELLEFAGF